MFFLRATTIRRTDGFGRDDRHGTWRSLGTSVFTLHAKIGCRPPSHRGTGCVGVCLNFALPRRRGNPVASQPNSAKSSRDSWSVAAATFSSRWARLPVPGIGSMTGDIYSSHAIATCAGLAFSLSLSFFTLESLKAEPSPSGYQGRKAMPFFSQCWSTLSEPRSAKL